MFFESDRLRAEGEPRNASHLSLMNADGAGERQLTKTAGPEGSVAKNILAAMSSGPEGGVSATSGVVREFSQHYQS
jgi:hypothetical protein